MVSIKCLQNAPRKLENTTKRFSKNWDSMRTKSPACARAVPSRTFRIWNLQKRGLADDEAVSARANRAGHASRARGVCLAGAFVGGKGSVYGIPREASAGLHENREPGPHL